MNICGSPLTTSVRGESRPRTNGTPTPSYSAGMRKWSPWSPAHGPGTLRPERRRLLRPMQGDSPSESARRRGDLRRGISGLILQRLLGPTTIDGDDLVWVGPLKARREISDAREKRRTRLRALPLSVEGAVMRARRETNRVIETGRGPLSRFPSIAVGRRSAMDAMAIKPRGNTPVPASAGQCQMPFPPLGFWHLAQCHKAALGRGTMTGLRLRPALGVCRGCACMRRAQTRSRGRAWHDGGRPRRPG